MKMNKRNKKNSGYALLVAIVTTSFLIIVSFVVINIAVRLTVIAKSNQESQYSYYNAESGIECAMYWDLKNATSPNTGTTDSAFATTTTSTIKCNGQTFTTGGGGSSNATSTFTLTNPKGCVTIKVGKVTTPADYGLTRIESYGYNNCVGGTIKKVERGITITY